MLIRRPVGLEVGTAHRCGVSETTNVSHKFIHPGTVSKQRDIGLAWNILIHVQRGRCPLLNGRVSKPTSLNDPFIHLYAVAA
jgi:hypothetical protein